MPFERIQDFLSKYQRYFSDKDKEQEKIRAAIARVSGIQLSRQELSIFRGVIVVTGSSVLKNELFLFKEQIIRDLHENGLTQINEIR